jgi:hypothetical protein
MLCALFFSIMLLSNKENVNDVQVSKIDRLAVVDTTCVTPPSFAVETEGC